LEKREWRLAKAMCARGCDEHFARDEIGRALLACLWEAQNREITGVGPGRFNDVLRLKAISAISKDLVGLGRAVDKPQRVSLLQSQTAPRVKQGAADLGEHHLE
jgi:hypothetical protein